MENTFFLRHRSRRLRENAIVRRAIRETRVAKSALIYPVFVRPGTNIAEPIPSMPGQYRYSVDRLGSIFDTQLAAGVDKILFFGIPQTKTPEGAGAWRDDGIVQQALRWTKEHYPNLYCISDVCMCEYTDHGHCGILASIVGDHIIRPTDPEYGAVDNDATLEYLARIAVTQVRAGADMVAPSDMMDGRVRIIRQALNKCGYTGTPIMSYAAKYSSAFYGPFRAAADSAPAFGDRNAYQMDYHNSDEALKEIAQDTDEGADIVMVKPALAYLDVINRVATETRLPLAAYSVSGEYSLIKAAAAAGYVDEDALVAETAVAVFRAGAGLLITYYAAEIAGYIQTGRIG